MEHIHVHFTRALFMFLACAALLLPPQTEVAAQMEGIGGGISLVSSPRFPNPYSDVTISLNDYSLNLIGADIAWYADGTEIPNTRNAREVRLKTNGAGEDQTVTARITYQGVTYSVSHTIRPIDVDIIIEADTYTPAFYNGRALPSANAPVRAIAVVDDGNGISWNTYSYRWSLGNTVLGGGAAKGKYSVTLRAPQFRSEYLSVDLYDSTGTLVGRKTIALEPQEPEMLFYEYSPLRGLYGRAISSSLAISGEDTTLFAEPYFLNTPLLNTLDVDFTWKLNNKEVPSTTGTPNAISLSASGNRTAARVSASAMTTRGIPQFVQEAFSLSFE